MAAATIDWGLINGFIDIDQPLVFNWVLQPNQTINALQQPVSRDGDFWLCGMRATSVQFQRPDLIVNSAQCGIRISDDVGYKLMNDFVNINSFAPSFGNSYPYVVNPSHMFKAGTRINIDLQEQSGVTNIVQIVFRGRYRYRMSDVLEQAQWVKKVKQFQGVGNTW